MSQKRSSATTLPLPISSLDPEQENQDDTFTPTTQNLSSIEDMVTDKGTQEAPADKTRTNTDSEETKKPVGYKVDLFGHDDQSMSTDSDSRLTSRQQQHILHSEIKQT
jgi:hypothetical protein